MNAITLCYACHIHFGHKEPRRFAQWLEENFPDKCAYIDAHWQETEHRKLADYQELVDNLRSLVNSLENK